MLELHIWGPAFGLPSLDPQCLATVAYFVLALNNDKGNDNNNAGEEEWVLIADSDPSAVPTSTSLTFPFPDSGAFFHC